VVGDERLSKHAFGARLARAFDLPEALIGRGNIGGAGLLAPRPRDMSLDNSRTRRLLGRPLGGTAAFFHELRRQEEAGRRDELLAAVTE
jgi:hypothetical protein